ncbi:glycosyltransferase family 2 protein [Shimia litoralis]|uniref:Glycosyltransferase family 2 protein n=1 Tax=Shimia litoralis TaxID=420403 RepID=A0A4U7N5G0_9RHOB|nr:glycosyltransferase family A protein [Shimia litoralis]TKZ20546.1 glycosyltransferase family 2 protein [Shimia litoralis]
MSQCIVSLSSIPPRFDRIGPTLDSLLAQTVTPDRIILYIARTYRRFPEYDGQLPKVPDGVEIRVLDQDYGPATKVLPAAKEFAGTDTEIFFGDDDQIYPPHLIERLLASRAKHPQACLAVCGAQFPPVPGTVRTYEEHPRWLRKWRVLDVPFQLRMFGVWLGARLTGRHFIEPPRRSTLRPGYADGFQGYLGVLVRPEFFPQESYDIPEFAFPVDDVWLSGQLTRAGHPTWVVGGWGEPNLESRVTDYGFDQNALFLNQFDGKGRGELDAAVVRYFRETYGIWG